MAFIGFVEFFGRKIGTIAAELQVHPGTVQRAIEVEEFQNAAPLHASPSSRSVSFLGT